jgi:hypothetical protein
MLAIAVDHKISAAMRDWVRVSPGMRFVYDAWERKPINRTIACNGDLELPPRIDGVFAVVGRLIKRALRLHLEIPDKFFTKRVW